MLSHQLLFYRTGQRLWEYRRHLRTRRTYCLLAVITYTNSLLYASLLFDNYTALLDLLFCISSTLIGISITGLYLNKPYIMVPDVIYKVCLATCAFFFVIQEADSGKEGSGVRLMLVTAGLSLQFYENYFLFNAIAAIVRESEGLSQRRPPPNYDLFAITSPKREATRSKPDSLAIEIGESSSSGKITRSERTSEQPNRPETPPPSYDIAILNLKRMDEIEDDIPSTSRL